jgi:hypothetical protein
VGGVRAGASDHGLSEPHLDPLEPEAAQHALEHRARVALGRAAQLGLRGRRLAQLVLGELVQRLLVARPVRERVLDAVEQPAVAVVDARAVGLDPRVAEGRP